MELEEQFFCGLESWANVGQDLRVAAEAEESLLVPVGQRWAGEGACTEVSGLADPELFRVLSTGLESSVSTGPSGEAAPAGKCKAVSLGNIIRALLAQDGAQSWQLGLGKGFWVVADRRGPPLAQCASGTRVFVTREDGEEL